MPPYERTLVSDPSDFDDIRFEVRRLCDKYGNEYWRGLEPDNYPTEFVQELTDQGWLGSLIPEEYGGGGLSLAGASVILEEISASGGNPSACHAQMYVMGTLLRHGSDDQKQHYLPQVADGRKRLQAFAVTEPAAGSETTAIRTRAERDGDVWRINGQKIWTSRAMQSDLMVLLARTTPVDEVEDRLGGISVFIVEMRDDNGDLIPGLTINPIPTMMNHNTN
ncbi:MAG: acyl-CoA dehydrogenase family protein, partial [Acidimicrobiales bacterium]